MLASEWKTKVLCSEWKTGTLGNGTDVSTMSDHRKELDHFNKCTEYLISLLLLHEWVFFFFFIDFQCKLLFWSHR